MYMYAIAVSRDEVARVHLPQNDMMIAKNKVPPLSNNWFTCKNTRIIYMCEDTGGM